MDKILVVDDEKINLMMVNRILGSDYEIATAGSGEEALSYLADNSVSLILLDIHMPGIDGYETIAKIKEQEGLANIPVIFLTADDDSSAEIHGFELGADDFIKKPFVSAVVKRRVERCIESFHLHCNLENEVKRQTQRAEKRRREVEKLSFEIIQTLATAIDAKDIYTKGHSARVADYCAILAKKLGWDEKRIEELAYKALLHDVGKIGIPDRILNKKERLEDAEFEIIKSHSTIGAEILRGVSSLSNMYLVARNHHERYDGKGYPDGLCGKDIPEEARLVGIADAYDAMSSDRVYRKALPKDVIIKELENGRGKQFDPDMLDAFLELYKAGELEPGIFEIYEESDSIDMAEAVENILKENNYKGALKLGSDEMTHIYGYMTNLHERYGINYHTVLISLTWDEGVPKEQLGSAMTAMEYSIEQSLRRVDIVTRVSGSQFLLILTDTETENIRVVVDRVFAGFYRNCQNVQIKPIYEIK
ncbi:MAG: HD-GYP domain-containing protein [Lachnospiraceae bacterium]